MDAAGYWAMLNPRSLQGMASRGYGTLSTNDIRLMLGGLNHGSMLMGMVFDAGDADSLPELRDLLTNRIATLSVLRRWQLHDNLGLSRVAHFKPWAELILIELAQDQGGKVSKKCYTCAGVGYTVQAAQPVICDTCHGIRSAKFTQAERAEHWGVSLRTWQKYWTNRYFDMQDMANDWLLEARVHLKSRVNKFFNAA